MVVWQSRVPKLVERDETSNQPNQFATMTAVEEHHPYPQLENYTVGSLQTLIYIPNFVTEADQAQLLHHIYGAPASRWKTLKNRRLQNWGGVVHEKGLLPQDLPSWLTKVTQKICQQTGLFPSEINHVLINEYLPDQGIMPHQDGPAYFPVVAILSLESPVVIDFIPHQRIKECVNKEENTVNLEHPCSLLLMPCSLLIFKDRAYSEYLHGIHDSEMHRLDKVVNVNERSKLNYSSEGAVEVNGARESESLVRTSTRVSLTCRLVLKVRKNLFKF